MTGFRIITEKELEEEFPTGYRGCCGRTKREGKERFCAQPAIFEVNGKGYCWYHNPKNPHKFGEGY